MRPQSVFWLSIFRVALYMSLGTGFLIRILVEHEVVPNIYFGLGATDYFTIISELDAAAMCCAISYIYCFFALFDACKPDGSTVADSVRVVDGILVPLMFTSLANLSDLIQIVSLVSVYVTFRVLVICWMYRGRDVEVEDSFAAVHTHGTFWGAYLMAVAYGWGNASGSVHAVQVCSLGMAVFDTWLVKALFDGWSIERMNKSFWVGACEMVVKTAALVCLFVKSA